MKKIKLKQMTLHNFKGIKNLEIDFSQTTNIFGANASGKTTVADSFVWLLFDKDTTGRKQFEIKTIDENNEAIHRQEHIVAAIIEVDDRTMTLKKVYKEKWTKKRGGTGTEFSGHTTDTYIDDVPYQQKDFQAKIEELLDEEVFKSITNPLHFNNLPWKDQRNLIITLAGEPSFEELIKINPNFKEFKQELEFKNTDEIKSMLANQKKKLMQDIKDIPGRIEEVKRSAPEINTTKEENNAEISRVSDVINKYNNYNAELVKTQQWLKELQKKVYDEEVEHQMLQQKLKSEHFSKQNEEKTRFEIEFNNAESKLKIALNNEEKTNIKKAELNEEIAKLRIEFKKVKDFDFVVDEHSLNCPTCNRLQENSAEIQEKQKSDFNSRKVIKIGELNKKGLALSKELKELESFVSDVSKIEKEILTVKNEFKNLKENVVNDFVEEPLKEDLLVKKMVANYKKKILEFEDADTKRAEYVEELKTLQIQQIEILQAEKGNARIDELINEESTKSIEIAEIEKRQDLLTQFVVAKVEAIQKKVDDKFKITTFKMFNTNINGGVEETCVALHNGVPFSDLNNAMKINVGLDIINALQKHYQVLAPIFIDNRESVSQIMKTDAQIINLRVSSKDKTLRIERKE